MENNYIIASWVNGVHFGYICPSCSLGKLKSVEHRHGSGNNFKNRIESRSRHCLVNRGDIDIIINDTTIRK